MTDLQLIRHLSSLGVRLWIEGDALKFSAPHGVLSASLKDELRARKDPIRDLLRRAPRQTDTGGLAAIPRAPRDGALPLSFGQERLWFLAELEPGNPLYTIPGAMRLEGPLDVAALERCFGDIVNRHEALRTTFPSEEGRARQRTAAESTLRLRIAELDSTAREGQDAAVRRWVEEEARQPFSLAEGPLVRAALLRLSERSHVLAWTMHHIVSDGWSMGVLVRELGALYQAFSTGSPSPLPELPIQYADFAAWQRQWLSGEVLEAQLAYWRERLAGAPPVLSLPTDRPRPPVQTHRGAACPVLLSSALSAALVDLSKRESVTLFMTLLAAFKTLLFRHTGEEDLVVGSPIAGRTRAETEPLIGFFVNTLVLRTSFAGEPTFRELLARVREVTLGAYAHQQVPFEKLVEDLAPARDLGRSPLFQVMFVLQNAPMPALSLGELRLRPLEVESTTAKFDLTLALVETPEGLRGSLEYDTDLFDAATIARMARRFQVLLEAVVESPERPIAELPLLTAEERQQLAAWNATAVDYPADRCVHELFEAQAQRTPDAVALVFEEQHLTYRELNRRANQLAHHLQSLGVGPEVLVGLCLERSLEMVVGLLAVLKAGGAYVPLDATYPEERLAFMLEDAHPTVLLIQQRFRDALSDRGARLLALDAPPETLGREREDNPKSRAHGETLAYVIYTSGSTGQPKGAMNVHRGLRNRLQWMQQAFTLDNSDTVLQKTPFSFDVSVWEFFWPLMVGARLVLARPDGHRDSAYLVRLIEEQKITTVHFVPSMLEVLVVELAPDRATSLRRVICSGEALSFELAERFFARSEAELWNLYGPTEASIDVSYWPCRRGDPRRLVPIGRPIANTRLQVLDMHRQPLPVGVPGELYIGGVGVGRGYLRRPELTEERFVDDPFSEQAGARLYRTGDLCRWLPDGALEFLGRLDHQIKLRGFRIELGEIEAALRGHPAVREAVVTVREDAPGDQRLVAYWIPREGSAAPEAALLAGHLRSKLPEPMVPAAFVQLQAMPLSPNGKLDRRALPAPDRERVEQERVFVAPRTPAEELLAGIWAEVLGVARVSVVDDFFALGGHSLLATRMGWRVRASFGVELPLRALFEAPTVASLGERIEAALRQQAPSPEPPLARAPRDGALPLSFAQQRLWFLDELEPNSAFYNIPAAIRLDGSLDVGALARSLDAIVQRHESLRTRFPSIDGQAHQDIAAGLSVPLPVIDLGSLAGEAQDADLRRRADAEAQEPFDLARGPLLRTKLLRLSERSHALLLTMHHIVSDGWSTSVLVRELGALYSAFSAGHPSPLPELPIQYADFAAWQRQRLSGEVLEAQLAYWREHLTGAAPTLELPTDRTRALVQSHRGASIEVALPRELSAALQDLSRREGVTLFMTLLATFQALLHRYAGQDDIVVGSPIAGRTRAETEGLIGCFVNTLVLRTDLAGQPTFRELLARVREVTLGAYAHQDVPFEKLVDELSPARDLGRSPLFQVMLSFQSAPPSPPALPGLTLEVLATESTTAKFDLGLSLFDTAEGIRGALEYRTDLFDAATIQRLMGHFQVLLEGAVAGPDRRISELPLLTAEERYRVLAEWNDTRVDYPRDLCIHELFEAQVERTPEAVAVVFEDQRLTYRALDRRANQLAHHLRARGIGPEVLVGICVERSIEMIVGLLGILKAGGAYVPLDPSYPEERLGFMVEDAAAPIVLVQDRLQTVLPRRGAAVLCLDSGWSEIAEQPDDAPPAVARPDNLAYVIYTSGSTGKPKGAMNAHRGVVNRLRWGQETYGLAPGDAVLQKTPFSFDVSVWELFWPLLSGARLVFARPEGHKDARYLTELIRSRGITTLHFVPSMLRAFLDEPSAGRGAGLTRVFCSGEALPYELQERFFDRFPGVELHNLYGPTEAAVEVTAWACRPDPARRVPMGRPIANTRAYVLDAWMAPQPIGVPGELYLGGVQVGRGYLRRPELTAERFVPDPFSAQPEARLYRTGDLVRWLPDGNLEYLGRRDLQVKVRGFRIELGEIESALGQHPALREAVVTAREDAPGDKRLVAYLVPRDPGDAPAPDELRSHLQRELPEHMIPSAFVWLAAIPLLPSGKVDRKALPAPSSARPGGESGFVAPRTWKEELLAGVFSEVLRLPRIGAHDSFFALGGDSILAIRVVSKAHQAGLALSVRQIFEHPTIAGLASAAGAAREDSGAEQGLVTGPAPLTPIQRWFFERDLPEPHHFNQALLLEIQGHLDRSALARSIEALLRHHDALRLRFVEGTPIHQRVAGAGGALPITTVDLSAVPEAQQAEAIEAAAAEAQASLSLSTGPLLCVVVLDLGPERPSRLLLIVHHLAVDGVSWRILLEDLESAYFQALRGEALRLPPKTTSFQRWAERLAAHAQSESVRRELPCWSSLPEIAPLPADLQGGDNTEASARSIEIALDAGETGALLHDLPDVYRTQINDVLLWALAEALLPWIGGRRLRLDLEGHGREEIAPDLDLSRTVGWFTTLFPVVLELAEAPLGEALKAVKEQLRRIPHRGLGHGLLRYLHDDAAVRAELAKAPPAEVSFNYLGQLDQSVAASSLFKPARESSGPSHSPRALRSHRLDVTGWVVEKRFVLGLTYSENIHRRETIEDLGQRFVVALRAIVAHGRSPEAGGRTPSDFPLARLTQGALDRLVGSGRLVEDLYPLSPMQQGLLFHTLREPGSGVYVEQLAFRIPSGLVVPAFERAWKSVIGRHPILRSAFVWEGLDEPLQLVHASVPLPFAREDWRGTPTSELEARLAAFLEADRARGFALDAAPLMRLALFRLTDDAYQVVWSFHHLLLDGWSTPRLFQELLGFYEAACQGRSLQLPSPPPYRDYIAWLGQQDSARAEAFWRETLGGFSAPTPLSVDRPRRAAPAISGPAEQQRRLPTITTAALEQFARAHGLTLNTVLQGAWALLLARYSGDDDVVFGATVSGRSSGPPGVETMIGLFINTLPVRVRTAVETAVVPWLRALQEQQAAQLSYAHTPLAEVQAWSGAPRGQALFESLLVVENYPIDEALKQGPSPLSITDLRTVEQTNYPLTVIVGPGRELLLRFVYARDRFDEPAIERMLGHYQTLLEGLVAAPERRPAELPILTAGERQTLLVTWNDTRADYPAEGCIHTLFEAQADRTPEAVAVISGAERLTYRELNQRANRLAHRLRSAGVRPGARVGLCAPRSLSMMVGLLGILKAGGAYVPLDPSYPRERLAFMLEDAGVMLLLSSSANASEPFARGVPVIHIEDDDAASGEPAWVNPADGPTADDIAYVIYTSGSTGRPKGVPGTHRGAVNRFAWMWRAYPFQPGEVCCQKTTLSFVDSIWEIFGPLLQGVPLVLIPDAVLKDVPRFVEALAEGHVTRVVLVPSLLRTLLDVEADLARRLPELTHWTVSGEALAADLCDRFLRELPGRVLLNLYGSSEVTADATCFAPTANRGSDRVPIGRPIANMRVYVLDARRAPVPVGVAGELYVGGVGVARGYHDRPELTAERFIDDPFTDEPGACLFKTGDRCRWLPDGNLEFLGRIDRQVKIRGHRIEPGEIEAALLEHPAIGDAAVIAREDTPGDPRLVAYLVAREGSALPGATEIANQLRRGLPEPMIPAAFVPLPAMPLSPNGKIDRRALPAPDRALSGPGAPLAPRDLVELALVQIWEDLLPTRPIGVRDDFFAIGGHSLLAVRLLARIHERFGLRLPLATLFEGATIQALARRVRQQQGPEPWSHLVAVQPAGRGRPFFCVHPAGGTVLCYAELAHHLGQDRPFYGLQALGIDAGQEPVATIEEMATRYLEALRAVQPEGPYLLGGWSLGGLVAFEMAEQLLRSGQRVALVALLDTMATPTGAPPDDTRLLVEVVAMSGVQLAYEELCELGPDEQESRVVSALSAAGVVEAELEVAEARRLLHVHQTHMRAALRYTPRVHDGPLAVFRAMEGADPTRELDLRWSERSSRLVEVHGVPGDHRSMIQEPHVRVLAAELRRCLLAADPIDAPEAGR